MGVWGTGRRQGIPSPPPSWHSLRGVSGSDSSVVLPSLAKLFRLWSQAPAEAAPTMVRALAGWLPQHPQPLLFDPPGLQLIAADSHCCSSLDCLTVPSALPILATNSLHGTTWHGFYLPGQTLSPIQGTTGIWRTDLVFKNIQSPENGTCQVRSASTAGKDLSKVSFARPPSSSSNRHVLELKGHYMENQRTRTHFPVI